jgi:hypothetical protein
MSDFTPTTTVTVERSNSTVPVTGTHVDGYSGDDSPSENWTPVVTGAPVYLEEDDQRTSDPSSGRMTVREVTRLRGRPLLDIKDRDRVVDEMDGTVYQVDTVRPTRAVAHLADVRAVLLRVTN